MENSNVLRDGWRRMFIVSLDRLMEVRELYESLGYEVKFEHPDPDEFGDECSLCAFKICSECYVVYVRKKGD